MTQDQQQRLPGAAMRRMVLGDEYVERSARERDPFLEPFFELGTEHVWGGLWNRPGLEPKYRSLVVIATLAALGRTHELRTHLQGGLNVGWTPEELREACLQLGGYAGYPAAIDALRVLAEVVAQRGAAR
jgi:4-carboxymuconolactone decarboxylase